MTTHYYLIVRDLEDRIIFENGYINKHNLDQTIDSFISENTQYEVEEIVVPI